MKKYRVYYSIVNNGSIEIEADGVMEAEEVVWQMLSEDELSDERIIDTDYSVDFSKEVV
tara:strand:+ start:675 stop:851 length:177 start_codon:yes stop_codon:yes gene_type:complete